MVMVQKLIDSRYFGNPQGALLGLVNAAQSIGSVLALPIVGSFSDRYGRKLVLLAGIIGVIVATIIQATATTLAQFVVSRLVVGFAGMFVVQPAPMLIAELAYPVSIHFNKHTSPIAVVSDLALDPSWQVHKRILDHVLPWRNSSVLDHIRN